MTRPTNPNEPTSHKPVWTLLFVLTGLIVVTGLARMFATPENLVPFRTDYQAAQSEARRTGKPLMIYFTSEWCAPCSTLRRTTWSNPAVARALEAFTPVEIDFDQHPEFADLFHVRALPTFIIATAAEARVVRAESGAMEPNEFIAWLKQP